MIPNLRKHSGESIVVGRGGGTELAPGGEEQCNGADGRLGPVGHRGVVLLV